MAILGAPLITLNRGRVRRSAHFPRHAGSRPPMRHCARLGRRRSPAYFHIECSDRLFSKSRSSRGWT